MGKSCSILANHRLIISCRPWLTVCSPRPHGTRKSIRDFRTLVCVTQRAASLLLATLQKEKELLCIIFRVLQMEKAVLRRMNLWSSELETVTSDGQSDWLAICQSYSIWRKALGLQSIHSFYYTCTNSCTFRRYKCSHLQAGYFTLNKRYSNPNTGLEKPWGSRSLRLPDLITIGTLMWEGCQPYLPASLTPRKYTWYLFLLKAESIPVP